MTAEDEQLVRELQNNFYRATGGDVLRTRALLAAAFVVFYFETGGDETQVVEAARANCRSLLEHQKKNPNAVS